MRLHIGVSGTEQFLGAIDSELLDAIHMLTTTVIALARVALGILVREDRALRFEHPRTGIVFRRDQFDVLFLAPQLLPKGGLQLRIESGDLHIRWEHLLSP